jgi:hypothetical protein
MGSGTEFEDYEGPTEWHHQFPQSNALKLEFETEGIDIEDYGIYLPEDKHRRLKDGEPYGVHTGSGDNWNAQWKDFFKANKAAGVEPDIYDKEDFLKGLQEYFDLGSFVTRCWKS